MKKLPNVLSLPISSLGSRLNEMLQDVLNNLDNYYFSMIKDFEVPSSFVLIISVDDRTSVNASAFLSDNGKYHISFSSGLCLWAYYLAVDFGILNENDMNHPGSDRKLSTKYYDLCSSIDDFSNFEKKIERNFPTNNEGFIKYTFSIIMSTVFFHELAHVLRGHVDFLNTESEGNSNLIDERILQARDNFEMLFRYRRGLEFDADDFGAFLFAVAILETPVAMPRWERMTSGENLSFVLLAYALFCLSIEEDDIEIGEHSESYPEPMVRFSLFVGRLGQIVDTNGDKFDTSFNHIIRSAFSLLAHFEHIFTGVDLYRNFLIEENKELLKQQMSKHMNERDEIFRKIKTFMFTYNRLV